MEEAIWQRPISYKAVSAFRIYANVWPSFKTEERRWTKIPTIRVPNVHAYRASKKHVPCHAPCCRESVFKAEWNLTLSILRSRLLRMCVCTHESSQPSLQERLCCCSKYFLGWNWNTLLTTLTSFHALKIIMDRFHCALFNPKQPCLENCILVQYVTLLR